MPDPTGLVRRWEALPVGRQLIVSYATLFSVLLAVHVAFFHRISFGRSLGYAIFEAIPLALMVVFASQAEAARRGAHDAPSSPDEPAPHPDRGDTQL